MNPDFSKHWDKLKKQANNQSIKDIQAHFADDSNRTQSLSFETHDVFVDFSKNWITPAIFSQLISLAHEAGLKNKITALFAGDTINSSEKKPAAHTAQRKTNASSCIQADREKMLKVAQNYRQGIYKTAFGKKVKTIINIGIGGSYLGPKLAVMALSNIQTTNDIKVLFYPSVDDAALTYLLQNSDLTQTLFCVSSKSLGTIETLTNTKTILHLLKALPHYQPDEKNQSFVVATTNFKKAKELSIPETHILPFDADTGGRFSVWSSIGFPVLMAIGTEQFLDFLAGAEKMDDHFQQTEFQKNMPVLMALLSIWYRNFLDLPAYAIIPYDVRLKNLPAWLQQLMMESNGKMVDKNGETLDISTSPWVFGDHGQLSQHAFFQTFHQGNDILPIDFIGVLEKDSNNQNFLLINMLAQSAALMNGNETQNKQNLCPGNRPSTTILLKDLSPHSLGQLLALYEHMIFVQSVIWNINCFDQPGVELGKNIAKSIVTHLKDNTLGEVELDNSTKQLLKRVLNRE